MDFFFFLLRHLWKGGGEAQENPEVLIIFCCCCGGLLLSLSGFLKLSQLLDAFCISAAEHRGSGNVQPSGSLHPGPKKKDQEIEFGKGLRRSRGHSLPGSHPHPRQPRSGAGRDRCKLRRWAQKLSPNPVWLLWLGCNGASRCTQGARRLPPK